MTSCRQPGRARRAAEPQPARRRLPEHSRCPARTASTAPPTIPARPFAWPGRHSRHRGRHHHVRQPGDADRCLRERRDHPGLAQSLFIPNITPDAGLSAPANSFFTFFGQFFDHGLDLISKNAANGTVFIPLSPDDPLYVPGAPTNFMVLTRAQDLPGPDGIIGTADDVHSHINQTSPFVDQSQTYGSDPSHQVFLREYMIGADGKLHSTGALLGHHAAGADGDPGTVDDRRSPWRRGAT